MTLIMIARDLTGALTDIPITDMIPYVKGRHGRSHGGLLNFMTVP